MICIGYFQKLGKALMLPIAVLPIAAMLLRLGQEDLLNIHFISAAGKAIFDQLPLLFAMGVAIGLSRNAAGAAALAGAVGWFVLRAGTEAINPDINMSFFGGLLSGIVAGHAYNRFSEVQSEMLGFFSGTRLVPIVTGLAMLVIAWVCGYVWPSIQAGVDATGRGLAESGAVGQFSYGFLNRILIPLGLHHVLNAWVWFGMGEFTNAAGAVATGDLGRFFAGDPTAGSFMVGFFPVMIAGLPCAALAMYLTAKKENRRRVGGVLLSVGLTASLTGITEPLEFMFMFLAPGLYALHAVLTGLAMVVTNALGILHGFGFSAGLFDLVLNWGLATNPWQLVTVCVAFGALYFVTFFTAIRLFNLKTPGREAADSASSATINGATPVAQEKSKDKDADGAKDALSVEALQFAKALGGRQNLTSIEACITRLRLKIEDTSKVDADRLKSLGAHGVVHLDASNVQVVLGPRAEAIAAEMNRLR